MKLEDLGFNSSLEKYILENKICPNEIGRVVAEHKERYVVRTAESEFDAEITGNMRFSAEGREDFPAVGDWVALTSYDPDFAIINSILPRFSTIKRQAVGQFGEVQIIATNIDYAFLVQAADRDFNLKRLERYLTICYSSRVRPIVILSKTDLAGEERIAEIVDSIKSRTVDVPVIAISNVTHGGYESVTSIIEKGKTYCMLGSSGVGKSTLLNNLSGREIMKTDAISASTNKGRHTTSHRELIVLENGGILIDNPGMREVGIAEATSGLATTFDRIVSLAEECKFKDCTHTTEAGCAVLAAVRNRELEESALENYQRLEREQSYFESSVAERRRKDKDFGKMLKNYKKDLGRKKF